MHANGLRLLKLINDLLDLVRLESGRMQVRREPVALPEFIWESPIRRGSWLRIAASASIFGWLRICLGVPDRDKLEKAFQSPHQCD